MSFSVVVPARQGSTRLPGKPLALIAGKPMLLHTLERAAASGAARVVAATDSEEVIQVASDAGFEAHITGECDSGSERVAMVAKKLGLDGVVVNLQCDEPEADPGLIAKVGERAGRGDCDCATAAAPIGESEAQSPDVVKVVTDQDGIALYFSRAVIPSQRDAGNERPSPVLGHVGIYAFAAGKVESILEMERSRLEICERLEQLSWLWNGWRIAVVGAGSFTHGVDTPEDLESANARLAKGG